MDKIQKALIEKRDEINDYLAGEKFAALGDKTALRVMGILHDILEEKLETVLDRKKGMWKMKVRADIKGDVIVVAVENIANIVNSIDVKKITLREIEIVVGKANTVCAQLFLVGATKQDAVWQKKGAALSFVKRKVKKELRAENNELVRIAYLKCALRVIDFISKEVIDPLIIVLEEDEEFEGTQEGWLVKVTERAREELESLTALLREKHEVIKEYATEKHGEDFVKKCEDYLKNNYHKLVLGMSEEDACSIWDFWQLPKDPEDIEAATFNGKDIFYLLKAFEDVVKGIDPKKTTIKEIQANVSLIFKACALLLPLNVEKREQTWALKDTTLAAIKVEFIKGYFNGKINKDALRTVYLWIGLHTLAGIKREILIPAVAGLRFKQLTEDKGVA